MELIGVNNVVAGDRAGANERPESVTVVGIVRANVASAVRGPLNNRALRFMETTQLSFPRWNGTD